MKRKDVPDEVKRKEKAQLELANRSHWTIDTQTTEKTSKLKYSLYRDPALSYIILFRFAVEYDLSSNAESSRPATGSRKTFASTGPS